MCELVHTVEISKALDWHGAVPTALHHRFARRFRQTTSFRGINERCRRHNRGSAAKGLRLFKQIGHTGAESLLQ